MKRNLFQKSFVANTVTTLNIFCGFLSIVFASQMDFRLASLLIIVAAVFDLLDGIVARLLGTSSRFGVELDSLSDVVSFGAAPAFLIYKAYMFQFGGWGMVLSSLLLVFGALRLARFNIQVENLNTKGDFKGLPIPMSAMTVSLFVLAFYHEKTIMQPFDQTVIPLIILLSLLMVSKIRYNALPKIRYKSFRDKVILFTVIVIILLFAMISNGEILFYVFIAIVFFGILRKLFYLILNKKDENGNGKSNGV
ncbi:MAG: CDP-diacylglycerol--serine O-phosphatidyltransferase [Ignavibacteriae bacterium HGW-Ignavibacteriae-3]|nr:MAG: CDP-diacylglycerol--serine O-phosphatidyltransferase [Ignavibacteriae bacterium HGW-Ignavibacteriae-3]